MKLSRLRHLLSPYRLQRCQELFAAPWAAWWGLAFLSKEPVTLLARSGASVTFSRKGGDQEVWDWIFTQRIPFEITRSGEVAVRAPGIHCFLRPGTQDFTVFREVVLEDIYRIAGLTLGRVIDLGANIGTFSALARRQAQRVVSVEAVAENHALAARNVVENGGDAADMLHRAVAGQTGQRLRIYKDSANSGCHSLSRSWVGGSDEPEFEEVETLSLADLLAFMGSGPIDYLKCDVEGAEYAIFLDCDPSLLQPVQRMGLELHANAEEPELPRRLASFFTLCGFSLTTNHPIDSLMNGRKRTLMMFCQRL